MWPCVQTVWKLPWAKTGPVLAYWFDCIGPLLAQNSAIIGPILARYKIVCWGAREAKIKKRSLNYLKYIPVSMKLVLLLWVLISLVRTPILG